MPLHGKIVVIKRSGVDGTEFPLTASCLFGRKPECDIRIQLPSVSKEHCRIDLNENKEVILTNLSSVNPTCVNGEALRQSERLKHGDVITIVDRSFRFEYPPAPTPKKRSSTGAKSKTLKVLQDQQVSDTVVVESGEKRNFEVSTGPHLKDGANLDNIHRSLEKTLEVESKEDGSQLPSKADSPFSELYQMIKKSLDVKTPRKSCASLAQTPSSKFCTPKPVSVLKNEEKSANFTPKKDEAELLEDPKGRSSETPQSVKKQRKIVPVSPAGAVEVERDECAAKSEATSKQRRSSASAQKFTVSEVLQLLSAPTFKSPTRRRSKETELAQSTKEEPPQAIKSPKSTTPKRSSPRASGSAGKASKKRKSGELDSQLAPKMKKKRVSFGGHLSPELFDKRMPPDSPLRRGAAPRRSLSVCKPRLSLLRRASVIGLLKEKISVKSKTPSPKKSSSVKVASPKTPPGKKLSKSASPSPKAASSAKKSPQSSSPKATSPGKRTPKSASPVQKSPKSRSSSPKSPRSRVTSPKAVTPAKTSPKSRGTSPAQEKPKTQQKSASPGQQTSNTTPTAKDRSSLKKSSPASLKRVSLTGVTSVKTSSDSGVSTPTVKGRFSVSLISTPSPTSEVDVVTQQEPSTTVTPKIQLKRRSMKSSSRRTPGVSRSARHILQRKSGVSRASMKAFNSWADIVKFGQAKTQVVAPTKKKVTQKTTKKRMSKLQTPARALKGHVSTGHADSPVTIVVGRAHKRTDAHPPGAAPRVVTNTALFKKDLKMDENLSGISEMFKTPANERKRRSLITERSATKTPPEAPAMSEIEPTLLNTPDEPGEMMVSPLSVASTVKSRRYNSEAVQRLLIEDQQSSLISDTPALEIPSACSEQQDLDFNTSATPKQKPELPECLTGVKRITKTPRQKAEPIEDLSGKILKTPRQKAEQQECLTGVKRILKTPRQTVEPLEDIRGKLLITPKQKPVQEECLTGVKRIFKTPKQKTEPLEDLRGKLLKTPKTRDASEVSLDGVKDLLETPVQEQKSSHQPEMSNVRTPTIKNSPLLCLTDVRKIKTPKEKYSPVEDMVGVKRLMRTPKEKGEPVQKNFGINRLMKSPRLRGVAPVEDFEGLQELMQEPETEMESNKVKLETLPQNPAEAPQPQPEVEAVEKNPPEEETSSFKVTELDPSTERKPARGRKGRTLKSEDKKNVPEPSEDSVISAPVRGGRRREKTEAAAPSIVKHATRGRRAEVTESINPTVEENAPPPSKAAPRPKRERNAQKAPEDSDETVQAVAEEEVPPHPESKRGSSAGSEDKEKDHDAHLEKAELKPKRGRKNKQPAEPKQNKLHVQTEDEAPKDEANNEQPEVLGAMEAVLQAPEVENSPDVEEIAEMSTAPVQKKSVRGRRAKLSESKEAEDEQEAAESSDKIVSAPVRGRRGKKPEVTAPPAVKQSTRTRNAKSQESASAQPAPETQVITEVSQTSLNTTLETNDSAPSTEEVAPKPVRGRKPKLTPAVSSDNVKAELPQPVPAAAGKPKRGRKMKSDPEEQTEVVMEDVKQQFQPPVSAKRGRNAQQKEKEEEEKSKCQEPVKKLRRTRKSEQDQKEEVQDEAESPPAEPVVMPEQATVAEKPRRGGRKAKSDTKAAAPADSKEAIEVPVVSTDEPKRGRRGKQVLQKVLTIENPERELEEQKKAGSSPQIIKASRARGRTNEISQDIPAKRARRGAATPVEITEESAVQTLAPVKPARRGKQASAKPTGTSETPVTDDPANPSEDLSEAAVEDSKSKKSVKFSSDLQVLEISKATPVKAARGRKSKLADVKSDVVSADANKPEEKDLSEEIVKAQPVRRGRRGVKAADVTADSTSEQGPNDAEVESQPKTRRGRSAKK